MGEQTLRLRISGNLPWQEKVSITVESMIPIHHTLALRMPDWCEQAHVTLNGIELGKDVLKGYLHINRLWHQGDTITLTLLMPVRRIYGNPLVRSGAGKVVIQRAPLVYCLEQADNGEELHNLWLPHNATFRLAEGKGLFAPKILIHAEGHKLSSSTPTKQLLWNYDCSPSIRQSQTLTFIPWFCWANRGEDEMRLWVNKNRCSFNRQIHLLLTLSCQYSRFLTAMLKMSGGNRSDE